LRGGRKLAISTFILQGKNKIKGLACPISLFSIGHDFPNANGTGISGGFAKGLPTTKSAFAWWVAHTNPANSAICQPTGVISCKKPVLSTKKSCKKPVLSTNRPGTSHWIFMALRV